MKNGTPIFVEKSQNGWLNLSRPIQGWLSLKLTRVSCGQSSIHETNANIKSLRDQALQGKLNAADTLVRYLYRGADGGPGEEASAAMGSLTQSNPKLVIEVLNAQSEEVRRDVPKAVSELGDLNGKAEDVCETALIQEGNDSPTAKTWREIKIAQPLPSILPDITSHTDVPILLPSELPESFYSDKPKIVAVGKGEKDGYEITLTSHFDCEANVCTFGGFSAKRGAKLDPLKHTVHLAKGLVGTYQPLSCGGSCAPPPIEWTENGVLYTIQLKLDRQNDETLMVEIANSAIEAGAR